MELIPAAPAGDLESFGRQCEWYCVDLNVRDVDPADFPLPKKKTYIC